MDRRPSELSACSIFAPSFFLSLSFSSVLSIVVQAGRVTVGPAEAKNDAAQTAAGRRGDGGAKKTPGIHSWRDSALPEKFFTLARLTSTGFIVLLTGACCEGPAVRSGKRSHQDERRQARLSSPHPSSNCRARNPTVSTTGRPDSFQAQLRREKNTFDEF